MRVIAGDAKGRRLCLPPGNQSRPTSDRTKEALFNILTSVQDTYFLDVYAGSGGVGIEALSRGASLAVFIERDSRLSDCIKNNLQRCGFSKRYIVMNLDVKRALRKLRMQQKKFDIIFADPPYCEGLAMQSIDDFGDGTLLSEDGVFIIQHSIREKLLDESNDMYLIKDQRKIGDTLLTFIKFQRM